MSPAPSEPDLYQGPDTPWLLAHTKPAQEERAAQQLAQQGFETCLLRLRKVQRHRTGLRAVNVPMFARYVFYRPSRPGQSLHVVRSTLGVLCTVQLGGRKALMPAACLQALRDHEAELARIDLLQLARLEPGQRVSLRAPLFEGMEGLVQSSDKDRVRVLIELMGRMTEIQLRSHQVQVSE